ncbi:DUF4097 family beta strand repeat protein [Clostridium sp. D2Q-11]|uniref:DUF4097 family beta strand repeat protein n=1 Tax=Anaeromonas frigoriresistens TaxID=2683708 RepID=A0A942UUC6_9FIRM|nr:DUF4097 family beta strand repeat-containing protein [Anaeromonas frigoriresistens]MBS4536981.1 DUF4097 family beta strand repeat protein [Anaeromonas frigoriresistens]
MSDEKIMILKMLKEGKISEEEAAKLLDALEYKNISKDFKEEKTNPQDNHEWEENFEAKMDKLGKKLENKFDKFGENFGEKMGKMGEDLSDGAGSLTDKIMDVVDSFMDKGGFTNILGNYETKNESLEIDVNDIKNPVLDIKSINGNINLNPWSKDYIYVEAICYLKKNKISPDQKIMELRKEDNKIILEPLFDSNIGVKLDISVPVKIYNEIKVITTNGKINIYDLKAENISSNTTNGSINLNDLTATYTIDSVTKNGRIILKDTKCNKINAITKNASIQVEDTVSDEGILVSKNGKIILKNNNLSKVDISTSNSPIKIESSNISYLFAQTSNGKLDVNDLGVDLLKEIKLSTSNSGIYINLSNFNKAYKIEATTTNSSIDLNLPQLVYDYNDKNKNIKAHKEGDYVDPIVFNLNTTNGSIKVG